MVRKGVEPAGLKRYRLAKKRRSAPKRTVKPMARRTLRRRASGRRYGRRRGSRMKPSILTTLALAYKAYDSYQEAQKAGSEKMNTFLTCFTGIKFGRFAADGMWDSAYFIKQNTPLIAGVAGSYALNYLPQTKTLIRKIPMVGRRFKW